MRLSISLPLKGCSRSTIIADLGAFIRPMTARATGGAIPSGFAAEVTMNAAS